MVVVVVVGITADVDCAAVVDGRDDADGCCCCCCCCCFSSCVCERVVDGSPLVVEVVFAGTSECGVCVVVVVVVVVVVSDGFD